VQNVQIVFPFECLLLVPFYNLLMLVECIIQRQCTTESECKNDEKKNRLHLNILIIIETSILSLVTHLRYIKDKSNYHSFTVSYTVLYCRLSYFAHVSASYIAQ